MDEGREGDAHREADVDRGADSDRAPQATPLAPLSQPERILTLDVLRGFALLGILVMNIPWFAWPASAFFNPTLAGGFEGANYVVWLVSHLLFDMKMWAIFSMLFGAGMLVFTERAAAAGRWPAGVYYRRLGWLLLFGLLHAYLLWSGDILYGYALCGMLLYPLRRLPPIWLILLAAVLLAIGVTITMLQGWFFATAREAAHAAETALAAGQIPTNFEQTMLDAWPEMKSGFVPDKATRAEEAAAHLGSYWDLFRFRAYVSMFMQTFLFVTMIAWRTTGMMLLGMALMKLGVLSGQRSNRFYATMMTVGYLVGIPIVYVGAQRLQAHNFDFVLGFRYDMPFNYIGSIFVALGHIGAVVLVWRLGALRWLTTALAAVGRMALTNYLAHSLVCSIIFFGWGFGLWGSLTRVEAAGVVLVIWAFQLIISPIWLQRFRFGPVEWLWRSLTYWKLQPFLRDERDIVPPATM